MKADLFRQLAALGLSTEQIAGVLDIMDAEAEERREKGRARWRKWKDNQPTNVSKRLPTTANVNSQLARAEDSSSNSKISEKDNISHEFESEIWPAYPRKAGKGAAFKAYRSARKRASFETILAGVKRYAAERAGEDPKFTKHAQGWFNGDHWADEPQQHFRPNATAPPKKKTIGDVFVEDAKRMGLIPNDEPHSPPEHLAAGDGSRQGGSPGIARRFAVPSDILGSIGPSRILPGA